MSQRERQLRRLRRLLKRDPSPILYACAEAGLARRRMPPDVLGSMTGAVCSCCRTDVLAHTPVLERVRGMARHLGVDLIFLCRPCSAAATPGTPYTEWTVIDPDLARRIVQWETESN
jgi:hypothetical protein